MVENTNTYIFDVEKFKTKCKDFMKHGILYYPMKSNCEPDVIQAVIECDGCFEVDSIEHIQLLIEEYGVNPSKILYSNVVKDDEGIEKAVSLGVTKFTIRSEEQYRKINNKTNEKDTSFIIRLDLTDFLKNVDISISRFGTDLKECLDIIKLAKENNQKVGISFYLPKDKVQNRKNIIDGILNALSKHELSIDYLDIGGGIYLEDFSDGELNEKLNEFKEKTNADVIIEPGSGLVDDCFELKTSIKDCHTEKQIKFSRRKHKTENSNKKSLIRSKT